MDSKKKFAVKIKKIKLKVPKIGKIKMKGITQKRWFRTAGLVGFILSGVLFGTAVGVYKGILKGLPSITDLESFEPGIITYIYADNDEVIGEYARQKRIEVRYEEFPEILKQAIIATEDPRFYRHKGLNFLGILRAVKEDIKLIFTPHKLHGGSTISQQLAREIFLHRRQRVRRKLKEVILALQIERNYSKEQILTMYCNQFNLGHGAYGVEAAAQLYFGKHASELVLSEAAMITGIFRGPGVYSPYNSPDRMIRRRNHVLNRLVEEKFISEAEGEAAKAEPLNVLPRYRSDSEFAAYFNEEVRKYLEKKYGADSLYMDGLKVYTTLDPDKQRWMEAALRRGLKNLDKNLGWRKEKINLIEIGVEDLEAVTRPFKNEKDEKTYLSSWYQMELEPGKSVEAVVLSVENNRAQLRIKDSAGFLTNDGISTWTGTNNLKNLVKRGDVIQVEVKIVDAETGEVTASLDQEPVLEGAALAIEPQTGKIKVMVGGYSFKRLKFNQAMQSTRQSGSAIKPILYTAALENGYTPATQIIDEPKEFFDKWSEKPYSPLNYDRLYKGRVTFRMGLEQSRNIVTAQLLEYISPQTGVDYCRKFGLTTPIYPYLSLALGAFGVRMIELVSAFTVFPNQGVRVTPYFIKRIEDKDGNVLEDNQPESDDVIPPQIAYIMTSLLQGTVQRGTAIAASSLLADKPLGGKTGTTDEYSDAWFMGFSPSLCAGVWVGHEKGNTPIGERKSGAVAALPIWKEFFAQIIAEEKRVAEETGEEIVREKFPVPPNLVFKTIDRKTGLLATPICLWTLEEVFLPGTEPDRHCTYEDHMMTRDYYNTLVK